MIEKEIHSFIIFKFFVNKNSKQAATDKKEKENIAYRLNATGIDVKKHLWKPKNLNLILSTFSKPVLKDNCCFAKVEHHTWTKDTKQDIAIGARR